MPLRIAMAGLLLLQAGSDADRLETALKKFGDRTYRIVEGGKAVGTATLRTRVVTEDDRKIAVLEDEIKREGKPGIIHAEKGSLDGLRLVSATRTDGTTETGVSVRDGDAYVSVGERLLLIKTTEAAVGERSLLRLVCAQEQKVGTAFKADVLELSSESLDEEREIRCVAKEPVDVAGARRDAFKWEAKDAAYWVSPDGILLRFKQGSLEMVLDSK